MLIIAVPICALATIALIVLYGYYGSELPAPGEMRQMLVDLLRKVPPPLFFIAFIIGPAMGIPLTVFYLTAIPVMGASHPAIGVMFGWIAVMMNMVITYALARGILHPVIERVIRNRDLSIPKIRPENEWKVVLAFRLSPMPFFLQNYILALGHAGWKTYLGLSMLIQGTIGLAVMVVGESILTGGLGYVLLALFFLLLLNLLFDAIRKRLNSEDTQPH